MKVKCGKSCLLWNVVHKLSNKGLCHRCFSWNFESFFKIILGRTIRSSFPKVFCGKAFLKNFANFTGDSEFGDILKSISFIEYLPGCSCTIVEAKSRGPFSRIFLVFKKNMIPEVFYCIKKESFWNADIPNLSRLVQIAKIWKERFILKIAYKRLSSCV